VTHVEAPAIVDWKSTHHFCVSVRQLQVMQVSRQNPYLGSLVADAPQAPSFWPETWAGGICWMVLIFWRAIGRCGFAPDLHRNAVNG